MKEPCIALTEPFDAPVVNTAQTADSAVPKRTSLPSMLAPVTPMACISGLPAASAQ